MKPGGQADNMNRNRWKLQSHKRCDKTIEEVLGVLIYGGPLNPLLQNLDFKTEDIDFKGVLNAIMAC